MMAGPIWCARARAARSSGTRTRVSRKVNQAPAKNAKMRRFTGLDFHNGGAMSVSRRGFIGGLGAALGYLGTGASVDVLGQNRPAAGGAQRAPRMADDYDLMAHLSSNENCWGPPESVMK